jgi:GntR family transcriptional regulator
MSSDQPKSRFRRRAPIQNSPRRAYDQIRTAIRSGVIGPGEQLVEDALISSYSTSRNSVREALQILAQDGLVTRHRGQGTTVAGVITAHPMEHIVPIAAGSNTGQLGPRLSNQIREIVLIPSNPTLQRQLGTEDDVLMIEQVALLNGPVYVGAFYYTCPKEGRDEFIDRVTSAHRAPGEFGKSMQATHGVEVGRVEVTVEAVACDSRTARLLAVEVGSPILLRERLVHDAEGRPVALDYVHFAAGRSLATSAYTSGDSVMEIVS